MSLISSIFLHLTEEEIEELLETVNNHPEKLSKEIEERKEYLLSIQNEPLKELALICLNEIRDFIDDLGYHTPPGEIGNNMDVVGIAKKFESYHYTKQLDIVNVIYDLNKEICYCPQNYIIHFLKEIFNWIAFGLEDDEAKELEKLIQDDNKGNLTESDKLDLSENLGFEWRDE